MYRQIQIFRALLALFLICTADLGGAQAQDYPNKPIRLIVPFPAGGSTDIVGRLVAQHLGERLGQSVIVDNRGGAGGLIGASAAAQAPADGYTLFMGTAEIFGIAEHLTARMPFNAATDFSPVALVTKIPSVFVVNPRVPAKDMKGLIALAKARPGSMHFGSPGTGTNVHLVGELLKSRFDLDIVHVPYKGGSPAIIDLLGGQIEIMPAAVAGIAPRIKDGQVRALAVTSEKRSPLLPEVPTMAEAGIPDFVVGGWFGILVRSGTPPAVIQRLEKELSAIGNSSAFRSGVTAVGGEGAMLTGREFSDFIASETRRWRSVVKNANIKPAP